MTVAELEFYKAVPAMLRQISEELTKINKTLNEMRLAEKLTSGVDAAFVTPTYPHERDERPVWDEARGGIYIPSINRILDADNLTPEPVNWETASRLVHEKGGSLPTKNELFVIARYAGVINSILREKNRTPLEYPNRYWADREGKSDNIPTLGFGFADNSVNVCVKNKYEHHYVRALREP